MDTTQVAELLCTSPRKLRLFLRSTFSTFVPVGSGARYDFTDREVPTLKRRFAEWEKAGKPRPASKAPSTNRSPSPRAADIQLSRDQEVWAEEGSIVIPDIRDPRVRARALADAKAAEERLELLLLARGMHITQLGDRRTNGKKS